MYSKKPRTAKTHVVHIITRLDMGGSAQNTLLTLLHLPSDRYELTLITGPSTGLSPGSKEATALEDMFLSARHRGVRIITLPSLVRSVSPWHDLCALCLLTVLLRRLSPGIVHTHTSKAGFIGRLAARLARVPRVVHTPHGHVFWGHFGPVPSWIFFQLERLACTVTDHLIALTPGEANDYVNLKVKNPEAISIIPSGVDLSRFMDASQTCSLKKLDLGIPAEAKVVGFVGWLWPVKGVQYLLESVTGILRKDPAVYLVLVGHGDEEEMLKRKATAAGLEDRVLFLGWRPDVHEILPCFDLLVLPSLNEGMGRVLVEAMAARLPVVGTRVGGIPDLIHHGENGLLVPPGDTVALGEAIQCLLDDPCRRQAMAAKGAEMCRPFNIETMVCRICDVYAKMEDGSCRIHNRGNVGGGGR